MASTFFFAFLVVAAAVLLVWSEIYTGKFGAGAAKQGSERLVGEYAVVLGECDDPTGGGELWVMVHGERWRARARSAGIRPGSSVEVVEAEGLNLVVAPASIRAELDREMEPFFTPSRAAGFVVWTLACVASIAIWENALAGLIAVPIVIAAMLIND